MNVLISGSHGLIGEALVAALAERGDTVVRLVRAEPGAGEVRWDPTAGNIDREALAAAAIDAVVHLAGEGIGDKRWTSGHKARVLDSRVRGTRLLATAVADLEDPPKVMISGSAIGYYGLRGDEILTEESSNGDDFLAHVVRQWEESAAPAADAGIRVVHIRTGLVLSGKGGILSRMMIPMRFFVGGRLGSGRQHMSWIALSDEIGAIQHLIDSDVSGPVNLTAPNPVTNAELTKALATRMKRPSLFPVPAFALRIVLGREMADETVLASQRVMPEKLIASGYSFSRPVLEDALAHEV